MFRSFLKNHDLSEYSFSSELFPAVEDRIFWDNFQNDTCVSIAEAEMDYAWPIIKATDFMEFKKSGNRTVMENIHLDRRIKAPYESRYDFGWMGYRGKRVNNWNPWILSNVLTVFLLTECNQRRKQKAIGKRKPSLCLKRSSRFSAPSTTHF